MVDVSPLKLRRHRDICRTTRLTAALLDIVGQPAVLNGTDRSLPRGLRFKRSFEDVVAVGDRRAWRHV
jgi:hypothetical protein